MSSSYSRTAWAEAKKRNADTYRLLDRRCCRSRCAQWHPRLPAGSRARRSMWNMGIAAAVLGGLAIIALKSVSQNANSPSTADAQQINTSIVVPGDIMQVQSRLIDLGYMIGSPDGLWGKKSRQALRAFKAANGIQADDRWGSEISAKLFSTQARKAAPSLATVNTVR